MYIYIHENTFIRVFFVISSHAASTEDVCDRRGGRVFVVNVGGFHLHGEDKARQPLNSPGNGINGRVDPPHSVMLNINVLCFD